MNDWPHREYLDYRETAAYLRLSERHLRKLVRERKVPHYRVGRRVLFPRREIDEWLRAA